MAHVCLLLIVVFLFEVGAGGLWGGTPTTAAYPPLVTLLFQLLRLLPLLALPQVKKNIIVVYFQYILGILMCIYVVIIILLDII